eukprot:Hpha_TRINITY_DN2280_c0_g1::TRINITY_DN2280_c0_g1_i1::g.25403::m.25403
MSSVRDWTVEDVVGWLQRLSLGHLEESFQSNVVDGATLLELEKKDLKDELEIVSLPDRKALWHSIEELKASGDSGAAGAAGPPAPPPFSHPWDGETGEFETTVPQSEKERFERAALETAEAERRGFDVSPSRRKSSSSAPAGSPLAAARARRASAEGRVAGPPSPPP